MKDLVAVSQETIDKAARIIALARRVSEEAPKYPQRMSVRIPTSVIQELREALRVWDEV